MFWKKHRKKAILSLAFALVISAFAGVEGNVEAASAMDLFKRVYKQASGEEFTGFHSIQTRPSQPKPQQPQPEQPTQEQSQSEPPTYGESVKPAQPAKPEQEATTHSSVADNVLRVGEKYLGTPYKYGAPYGQTNTFDCSSFTKTAFAENGITLPRSSRQQAQVGTYVPRNQLQKGDLIFTSTSYSSNISHVAIYAGNDKVLHTYGPGGVRYDKFSGSWLERNYITARRVIK